MISWPAAKGIKGSSANPSATVEPSGRNGGWPPPSPSPSPASPSCLLAYGFEIGAVVALQLRHRISTELLEKSLRESQRDHCLTDEPPPPDHTNITALVIALPPVPC